MAEKKQHTIVSASTGENVTNKPRPQAAAAPVKSGNATGLRIAAVLFWVVALALEVLAIALIFEKIAILPKINPLYKAIGALALDMIFVIIGAQFWKKANHIDPASQKNAVKFWLWNNMGVIVAAIAFIPFIILLLTNKEADKKTKVVGTVVAAIFLAISGLASYEWNPISAEAVAAANAGQVVYWTEHGKKFHVYEDCGHLDHSETLYTGTAEEAINNGRGTICKTCERRLAAEKPELIEAAETVQEELDAAAVNE
ncbi:MAG: hypothetical protein VZR56_12690 [Treponema sp.]|nr:hypothetical protein [Treponema sp.]